MSKDKQDCQAEESPFEALRRTGMSDDNPRLTLTLSCFQENHIEQRDQ